MDCSLFADFAFFNMQNTVVFNFSQICHFLRHIAIFISDALRWCFIGFPLLQSHQSALLSQERYCLLPSLLCIPGVPHSTAIE